MHDLLEKEYFYFYFGIWMENIMFVAEEKELIFGSRVVAVISRNISKPYIDPYSRSI